MKRLVLLTAFVVALVGLPLPAVARPHVGVSVSFEVFHSSLASYGNWVFVNGGVRAWHPAHLPGDWRPYTVGRWVWTDDGWYWFSEEPWAWAVYHYGRWEYDDFYGWVWVPGYDWAPAWVEWRIGASCIGWAPLGPAAVFEPGYGLRYSHFWRSPTRCWTFVDIGYIDAPDVYRHAYPVSANGGYLARTVRGGDIGFERGRIVNRGPGRDYVEGKTGRRVRSAEILDGSARGHIGEQREGGRDVLRVYRPEGDGRGTTRSGAGDGMRWNRAGGRSLPAQSGNSEGGRRPEGVRQRPELFGRPPVSDGAIRDQEREPRQNVRTAPRSSGSTIQRRSEQRPPFETGVSREAKGWGGRSGEGGRRAEKSEEKRLPGGERGRRDGG